MNWRERAGCVGLAPMFDDDETTAEHIAICCDCPVRLDCLAEGMKLTRERDFGVWGGLGRLQRQGIRMRRTTVAKQWRRNLRMVNHAS